MPDANDDLDLLAALMRYAPVSSRSNLDMVGFITDTLRHGGAHVDVVMSEDGQFGNIVATIGPARDDRAGLTLSGHIDVVPADEPQWVSDPFVLRIAEEMAYGRGACDMLGPVALFMNMMREAAATSLQAPLALALSYGEELGSIGAQRLVENYPAARQLPQACIVGEPTSLRVVRLHKGHLKMRVAVGGTAAHSGSPHLGVNAIEAAVPVLAALSTLRQQLENERSTLSEHFPQVPFVALNIARVRGGAALNVIPESCVIDIGLRPLPGMDSAELIERVCGCARAALTNTVEVEVINDNPPMLTPDDAPINRELCALVEQRETVGVSFSSDGGIFARDFDMHCVLFGPGSIEQAHRPNEFVPIRELEVARRIIGRLIEQRCMERQAAS